MAWPHIFGGLAGNIPLDFLDDNFNDAVQLTTFAALAAVVTALPSDAIPLIPVAGGSAGVATDLARADHQHPPQSALPRLVTGTSDTILASDNGGVVEFENAAAIAVTFPALGPGFSVLLVQTGGGRFTVTGSGVTVRNSSSQSKSRAQWSEVTAYIRGNGTDLVLGGDTGA